MKKEFTKADLKDGMVVEHRDGEKFLVLGEKMINRIGFRRINKDNDYDVVKVYKVKSRRIYSLDGIFNDECLELIWERKETKKMTAEEMRKKLEELTGEKIEVEPSIVEKYWKIDCYCNKTQCSDCCLSNEICTWNNEIDDKENVEECYKKIMEYEK